MTPNKEATQLRERTTQELSNLLSRLIGGPSGRGFWPPKYRELDRHIGPHARALVHHLLCQWDSGQRFIPILRSHRLIRTLNDGVILTEGLEILRRLNLTFYDDYHDVAILNEPEVLNLLNHVYPQGVYPAREESPTSEGAES